MSYLVTFEDGSEAYLEHHGIKGMHWGEWNSETAARYKGGSGHNGKHSSYREDSEGMHSTRMAYDENYRSAHTSSDFKFTPDPLRESKDGKITKASNDLDVLKATMTMPMSNVSSSTISGGNAIIEDLLKHW